jgi:hypothetical protein
MLLKKSMVGFCNRQAKKSTSQIAPQAARERSVKGKKTPEVRRVSPSAGRKSAT